MHEEQFPQAELWLRVYILGVTSKMRSRQLRSGSSSATSLPPGKPRYRCARLHGFLFCIAGTSGACAARCPSMNTQRRESGDRKEYTRECKDDHDKPHNVVSLLLLGFLRLAAGCAIELGSQRSFCGIEGSSVEAIQALRRRYLGIHALPHLLRRYFGSRVLHNPSHDLCHSYNDHSSTRASSDDQR